MTTSEEVPSYYQISEFDEYQSFFDENQDIGKKYFEGDYKYFIKNVLRILINGIILQN